VQQRQNGASRHLGQHKSLSSARARRRAAAEATYDFSIEKKVRRAGTGERKKGARFSLENALAFGQKI